MITRCLIMEKWARMGAWQISSYKVLSSSLKVNNKISMEFKGADQSFMLQKIQEETVFLLPPTQSASIHFWGYIPVHSSSLFLFTMLKSFPLCSNSLSYCHFCVQTMQYFSSHRTPPIKLSQHILADYSRLLYKPFGTVLSQTSPNLHTFSHSQVFLQETKHFSLRPISWGTSKERGKKKSKGFGSVARAIERPRKWKGLVLKMFFTMSEPIPNGVKQEKHS